MNNDILGELEELLKVSASKRQNFLIAITKSSKAISDGASNWFSCEAMLLNQEMHILENIMPDEVLEWANRLGLINSRFQRAIIFLNKIVEKAEKGQIASLEEVNKPKSKNSEIQEIPLLFSPKKEEEKELNLVSAMLEVFDSATELEKLICEVEKESKRTLSTAKLVIKALKK